jgi:hypothetical protein
LPSPRPVSLERRIVHKNRSLIEIFALGTGVHNCNTLQKKDRYVDAQAKFKLPFHRGAATFVQQLGTASFRAGVILAGETCGFAFFTDD